MFRNPVPSASGVLDQFERGEGKWAGGCFFTDPETGQRTWVPDSNLLGVPVG